MILYSTAILITRNVQYYLLSGIVSSTLAVVLAEITFVLYKPRYRTESFLGLGEVVLKSFTCKLNYIWIIPLFRFGKLFITDTKLLFVSDNTKEFSKMTVSIMRDAIVSISIATSLLSHKIKIEEKDQTHNFIMSRFKDRQNVAEALTLLRQLGKVTA